MAQNKIWLMNLDMTKSSITPVRMCRTFLFCFIYMMLPYLGLSQKNGAILFEENCASCHSLDKIKVGPALKIPVINKSREEFFAYQRNPDSNMFVNKRYYKNLRLKYRSKRHISFSAISKAESDSVYNYIVRSKSINLTTSLGAGSLLDSVFFYFKTDSVMVLGDNKSYIATLNLSKSHEYIKNELSRIISQNRPEIIVNGQISHIPKYIHAELQSSDFEIEEIGKVTFRDASVKENLDWVWDLKPKVPNAEAILFLNIYFSQDKNAALNQSDDLGRKQYIVKVIARKASFGEKVQAFLAQYWQWLMGAIVIPLIAFLFNHFVLNKKKAA